jgi:hypothetical protein
MPYISESRRNRLDNKLGQLIYELDSALWHPGDVAYVIARIAAAWYAVNPRYERIATIIGVLNTAGMEFYRRIGEPHEDIAMDKHGDVYPGPK